MHLKTLVRVTNNKDLKETKYLIQIQMQYLQVEPVPHKLNHKIIFQMIYNQQSKIAKLVKVISEIKVLMNLLKQNTTQLMVQVWKKQQLITMFKAAKLVQKKLNLKTFSLYRMQVLNLKLSILPNQIRNKVLMKNQYKKVFLQSREQNLNSKQIIRLIEEKISLPILSMTPNQ